MDTGFTFDLISTDPASRARAGLLNLPHGRVETPAFMPVGTQASVKALTSSDLQQIGAPIILSNAYHLYLRPGVDVIAEAGGLHSFMNWDRPLLTDSGGFQVFSLAALNKVDEQGVRFRSHLDGSEHFMSPEKAIEVQQALGADIIMCFDECTSYPATSEQAAKSLRLTLRWAERCKKQMEESGNGRQALFGIVQGSVYEDLRAESLSGTLALDFPGYAIGGVSVGESGEEMIRVVEWCTRDLPEDKPRYLMGVGPPEDLLEAIERGVDMFDCVMPTRNARNGSLFTSQGKLNIKNSAFIRDFGPLDPACECPVCRDYSRAYLSHLYRAGEISALRLNSLHNVHFLVKLATDSRRAILDGRFPEFKRTFLQKYRNDSAPA